MDGIGIFFMAELFSGFRNVYKGCVVVFWGTAGFGVSSYTLKLISYNKPTMLAHVLCFTHRIWTKFLLPHLQRVRWNAGAASRTLPIRHVFMVVKSLERGGHHFYSVYCLFYCLFYFLFLPLSPFICLCLSFADVCYAWVSCYNP